MAKETRAKAGADPAKASTPPLDFAKGIGGFLETYQRSMEGLVEQLKTAQGVGWGDPAQILAWMQKSAAFPAAMPGAFAKHPLLAGMRHVFAGAHDAVGWGVYSKLADAMSDIGAADQAARAAQAKAWKVFGDLWETARARFGEELKAMAGRGESFPDVQAFLRAWTKVLDKAAHEALQSGPGVEACTEAMREASRLRAAQNRAVELVSEIYNVPTRAEVDEAYRLIHELRKEVRALRKRAG